MVSYACECFDRPPHTHIPERAMVRLDHDTGPVVLVDAAHYQMNKTRIVEVIEVLPPTIVNTDRSAGHGC